MNKKIFALTIIGMLCLSNMVMFTLADEEITINIEMKKGWNLITIPVENDYNASDLAAMIDNCTMISRWNYSKQSYEGYIVHFDSFDFEIEDGYGLFIFTTSDSILSLTGNQLFDVDVNVVEKNNLLGHYEPENTTASEVMNLYENCDLVQIWDSKNQEYLIYEGSDDSDFNISQGMGYFMRIGDEPVVPDMEFELDLKPGLNSITIPVENDYNASDLADMIDNCTMIMRWDPEIQDFIAYIKEQDVMDFKILDGHGYYVVVNNHSTLNIQGEKIIDADVEILEGYNLLGHYTPEDILASEIMNSHDNCTQVRKLNASSQEYIFYNGTEDEDFIIKQGMGYFIVINSEIEGLDLTPPVTEIKVEEQPVFDDWYNNDVLVTLSATDELSGVKETFYCIDRGEMREYKNPFIVSSKGENIIRFYSVDNAGNIEEMKQHIINIDKTAPKTKADMPNTIIKILGIPIYFKPIDISLHAYDSGSGVKSTLYRFKADETSENILWNTYKEPIKVEETGKHTIDFYSTDNVGNIEGKNSITFIVINKDRLFNSEL